MASHKTLSILTFGPHQAHPTRRASSAALRVHTFRHTRAYSTRPKMKSSGANRAPTAVVLLKDCSLALFPIFQQRQKLQIIAQYAVCKCCTSFRYKKKKILGNFTTVDYHRTLILGTQRYTTAQCDRQS